MIAQHVRMGKTIKFGNGEDKQRETLRVSQSFDIPPITKTAKRKNMKTNKSKFGVVLVSSPFFLGDL